MGNRLVTVTLAIAVAGPMVAHAWDSNVSQPASNVAQISFLHGLLDRQAAGQARLASLKGAVAWLNSPPLTPSDLRGKVVLVDFWTYTCINWLRTEPYIRAWAKKYKNDGLVVIGVHTPEFRFEKDIGNVQREVKELAVDYPVAVDSDYVIWRAFNNSYWPAIYFIDAQGRVRHQYFGEGSYAQSEMIIQRLLAEAGAGGLDDDLVSVDASGFGLPAAWSSLKSPENYVGYQRTEGFSAPGGAVRDKPHVYELPARLGRNNWALAGDWTIKGDAAESNKPNGRLAYRFHARDLHLVMGPSVPGTSVGFRVLMDGKPPGAAHGLDVDEEGRGNMSEQRLYQLIRQPGSVADHQFEIEFSGAGAEGFCFTFG